LVEFMGKAETQSACKYAFRLLNERLVVEGMDGLKKGLTVSYCGYLLRVMIELT
jgi:hypothetical protein